MAIDNDLSAILPHPPPPRPARRDAAIDEALRRFDTPGQDAPSAPARVRPARSREGWGRPQVAALASAVLVLMVSVPIWWAEKDTIGQVDRPATQPERADAPLLDEIPERRVPEAPAAAEPAPAPMATTAPAAPAAPAARAAPSDGLALAEVAARQLAPAPAPPPAPPPPPGPDQPPAAAARMARAPVMSEQAITVTGSRIARQDYAANSPVVSVDDARLTDGGWNDCTVLDPRRDLAACRGAASSRAATQVASGLSLAWDGDFDRAIAAFDRAIAAAPSLSAAYLNRGLAYQSKGDLRRALSDLNAAVARDATGARGYYHRSRLYRATGDAARADQDAARAIALDPRYRAALP